MNTHSIGDQTVGVVIAALLGRGFSVSIPLSGAQAYDLVVDDGERLLRAQCKTGRLRNGVIRFNSYTVIGKTGSSPSRTAGYRDKADVFLVYCPETGSVYQIPVDESPANAKVALRVEPSRNNQTKGVRMAADYLLSEV